MDRGQRYFEPFVGGGALFFYLRPRKAFIADRNAALIECYQAVKETPDLVVSALRRLTNSEAEYYRIRDSRPRSKHGRAARLIYLCRLSFNGIYRENQNGEFNVPYSYRTELDVAEPDTIRAASECLRGTDIACCDFEEAVSGARAGDVVYFDPPYTVAHNNNGFVKYNATLFSWSDQQRLATVAQRLAKSGCRVLISNADHATVRALYPGFSRIRIKRQSVIAASSDFRKEISEVLIVSPNGERSQHK